jgi:small conductance mechanosensitive channel
LEHLTHYLSSLADGRLGPNLIAIHGLITITVLGSLLLRRVLLRSGGRLGHWTGVRWLETAGEEAARRASTLLFLLTVIAVVLTFAGGIAYHVAGRDAREDFNRFYGDLSAKELLGLGTACGEVLGILVTAWFLGRTLRHLWPFLEGQVANLVGRHGKEESLRSWFRLVEFYVLVVVRLAAAFAICAIAGIEHRVKHAFGFLLLVLSIAVATRLLVLTGRILFRTAADLGNRLLTKPPLRHYWERFVHLLPFAEHCFDAAVYVTAAWLAMHKLVLEYVTDLPHGLGYAIDKCIGIFFLTRVLIELLQVLLNQAFGLYDEEAPVDQKGRTLVPLLYSVSQYVLYFGSALMMMSVLNLPTAPILAGAGILGLAVGLGAQSLVSDVVSGFFILFESQYLVGDYVQINDATGIVEAVGIRVTQIRDGQGKLHIIPNGQIKGVVSYSKDYVNAVVDVHVPSANDLEGVFKAMAEAGKRLRQAHREALADTQIHGLVELGTSEMTVRAVTKVRPGTHGMMQNEYRRLLKQVFDEKQGGARAAIAA